MSKLAHFTNDGRPYGLRTVYVNPDDVSTVTGTGDSMNPSMIVLRSGDRYTVNEYPDKVVAKLEAAKGESQKGKHE